MSQSKANFLILEPRQMTYKEWLIGMAMQGLCANSSITDAAKQSSEKFGMHPEIYIAGVSIQQADACIAVLEKESK